MNTGCWRRFIVWARNQGLISLFIQKKVYPARVKLCLSFAGEAARVKLCLSFALNIFSNFSLIVFDTIFSLYFLFYGLLDCMKREVLQPPGLREADAIFGV